MADNYLERKMEDLRSGKVAREYRSGGFGGRRTGMHFTFHPRRVLIASKNHKIDRLTDIYIKADCKVAVMTDNQDNIEKLINNSGVRLYPYDTNYLIGLLKAWRDFDIVIADSDIAESIIEKWLEHRTIYPYVSDYVCRIILFGHTLPGNEVCSEWEDSLHSTINVINHHDISKDISSLIAMLSLPSNSIVKRMVFEI